MAGKFNSIIEFKDDLSQMIPEKIVKSLDNYIIGQEKAKKLVAIALRNRIRRKYVSEDMKNEIYPKNILMIGPTGVGKTEIARRMAQIVDAPFIKVEATKFTERGYVGRDVEYMIRALVNYSIDIVKNRMQEKIKDKIIEKVYKEVATKLFKKIPSSSKENETKVKRITKPVFDKLLQKIKNGEYDDEIIRLKVKKKSTTLYPMVEIFPGIDDVDMGFSNMLNDFNIDNEVEKNFTVKEAIEYLTQKYMEEDIDKEEAIELGLKWAQEMGIVFIDEIDKISDKASGRGPDVSREGVQRDLLPIIEGTTVNTKYGMVRTDHILFIAAGAFHVAKPSDMIPELQGRFPIRVELHSLKKEDLKRILVEPKNSLVKQYQALLETESVKLIFDDEALDKISEVAYEINATVEDIGARRLHTIMEYLLEDVSFNAPTMKNKVFNITKEYVENKLSDIIKNSNMSRYIL